MGGSLCHDCQGNSGFYIGLHSIPSVKARKDFNWKHPAYDSKKLKLGPWRCRKLMSNLKSGCCDGNITGEKGNLQNR